MTATDEYSNNNSSNQGFLSTRIKSSSNGMDIIPEPNPINSVGLNANTTITSSGIQHSHQIVGPPMNLEIYSSQLSPSCGDSDDDMDSELESNADEIGSNYSLNSGKRQKRGILPKHATSVMRAWLFQHLVVSRQSD